MPTFRNPANGYTETTGTHTAALSAILGIFYFLYMRSWAAAALSLVGYPVLLVLSARFSEGDVTTLVYLLLCAWVGWGFLMVPVIEKSFLRRGWILVPDHPAPPPSIIDDQDDEAAAVPLSTTRPCPFCAEDIKAAAIVCRFCGRDVEPVQARPHLTAD